MIEVIEVIETASPSPGRVRRRLSREVEAQLRTLDELNDRESLILLWQAIRETEGTRR